MHDYGMSFCYNYFEDDCWGNAGFNLEKSALVEVDKSEGEIYLPGKG